MGAVLRSFAAAAAVALVGTPGIARAQTATTRPPLEDVTLNGRVLHADGTPVANTPLRVDAINHSGFAVVGFFFSAGFSTLACFTADKSMCPIPNSKRYASATDAAGHYSFTFHNAHRRGEQTDTDYVLSVGVASKADPTKAVVGSYELELRDAVHDAPDLRLWDPQVTITAEARDYRVGLAARPSSKNGTQVLFGDKPATVAVADDGTIDARAVEDQTFSVVAHASQDVKAAGTIYHQRFTAAAVSQRGALVPLSRGKACTATRADGTTAHCGYTDGDLTTPGVVDANPCGVIHTPGCAAPVTRVSVDLGGALSVGQVVDRCSCTLEGSTDGASWFGLPASGSFGPETLRSVRVTGNSLAAVPEISVWPPWPAAKAHASHPLLPDGRSNLLVAIAAAVLALSTFLVGRAAGRRRAGVRP